jgi:hypothetical protein
VSQKVYELNLLAILDAKTNYTAELGERVNEVSEVSI